MNKELDEELEMRMSEIEEIQNGVSDIKETLNEGKGRLDKLIEFFNLLGNDSMSDKEWAEAMKGLTRVKNKLK